MDFKKNIFAAVFVSVTILVNTFAYGDDEHHAKNKPITIGAPPKTLEKYYPPQSNKFEWLGVMHAMSGGFQGAWIDAKQGDWKNALDNAAVLEENYKKTFDMSSEEWKKKYFKTEAATSFKNAVAAKDMKKMGEFSKELGGTCHDCHYEQYANVWLKFYWNDIDAVELDDPITEKKLKFEDYKHNLVSSFYTMLNDGKQAADQKSAIKAGKEFIQRFNGLKASCMKCHDDEHVKYFFVGGKVEEAVNLLSDVLSKEPLDMNGVYKEVSVIGKEGCKKCHLTHRMATILKKGQKYESGK